MWERDFDRWCVLLTHSHMPRWGHMLTLEGTHKLASPPPSRPCIPPRPPHTIFIPKVKRSSPEDSRGAGGWGWGTTHREATPGLSPASISWDLPPPRRPQVGVSGVSGTQHAHTQDLTFLAAKTLRIILAATKRSFTPQLSALHLEL